MRKSVHVTESGRSPAGDLLFHVQVDRHVDVGPVLDSDAADEVPLNYVAAILDGAVMTCDGNATIHVAASPDVFESIMKMSILGEDLRSRISFASGAKQIGKRQAA